MHLQNLVRGVNCEVGEDACGIKPVSHQSSHLSFIRCVDQELTPPVGGQTDQYPRRSEK